MGCSLAEYFSFRNHKQ